MIRSTSNCIPSSTSRTINPRLYRPSRPVTNYESPIFCDILIAPNRVLFGGLTMLSRIWFLFVGLLLALTLIGCSGGDNPLTPPPPDTGISNDGRSPANETHHLWGYFQLIVDPSNESIEIIPLRHSQLHVNVLRFLESGLPKLGIKNLSISDEMIEVDVELTHPFNGMNQYTGFDVRGIFITPGAVSGYADTWITHASPDETYLTNADGWTRWWNPTEFPLGENIFSYMDGKLGTPYNGSNLNSTLNAYKYFCDDLDNIDGLDMLEPDHRGMFQSGYTNERHYSIHFEPTSPLIFNYAVDASWEIPDPDPPHFVPDDFPPEANMPEAYRIDVDIYENDLYYIDDSNRGGQASLSIYVYDWMGCGSTEISIQQTDGSESNITSAIGGSSQYSTYSFEIDGLELTSSDDLNLLVFAESTDAQFEFDNDPENLSTAVFTVVTLGNDPVAPTVFSIDPTELETGSENIDIDIDGENFASNAQAELIDDETGMVIIELDGEVVTGGNHIDCTVTLTDPSMVFGKYDVRVTNPDTTLWGELDKGFTVKDTAHPWPSWRGGDLNMAASQYVGYGDSSASGTPKWTFPAIEQGDTGCAVANDGTIYFLARNNGLYAVNPDGTEKWYIVPQTPWSSICPAIDDEGYIYVCMGTPSANYLHKINPDDGSIEWSCYLSGTACYATAPSIGHDGAVYVTYSTAYSAGYIQRVNPDGTLGWNYWIPSSAYSYTWQLGTAILENGNIIATGGTHGRIICFEPDGDIVWTYQHTSWILHTPCVGPEGNIYFTTWMGGDIVAIDSDGNFLWDYDTSFYMWATPAVDPVTGNVFVGDRLGHFRCFDNEGTILWDHPFAGTGIDGSAAVDANGDVYVGVGHQPSAPFVGLVKMDGDDGTILWQSDNLGYLLTHSPSIGADGTIYMTGHFASTALYAWGD